MSPSLLRVWLLLLSLLMLGGAAEAATTQILTEAETSWNGRPFAYPPGAPRVTAARIRLKAGEVLPVHCHPVPLFAYVLSGRLEVTTLAGETRLFKRGEAFVEVMDTWHQGKAKGGPVKILAFYAGEIGTPDTVLAGEEGQRCQP